MAAAYLKSDPVLPSVRIPYWCAGKHKFESATVAAEVAARNRHVLQHYRCRHCGHFHIGAPAKLGPSHLEAKKLIR